MAHDATEILEGTQTEHEQIRDHLRPAADWFHDREGELFTRPEATDLIADDLDVDDDVAGTLVRNLVSDVVDPIVQIPRGDTRYVGVVEFVEGDGWYGYVDYHDALGKRKRVVCAQCVHEVTLDTNVANATAGDGSFANHLDADYDKLASVVHDHYKDAHDVRPESVETGASLVSGTTIGGNAAWHAGNDGGGSGLNADTVDGQHASGLGNHIEAKVGGEGDSSPTFTWTTAFNSAPIITEANYDTDTKSTRGNNQVYSRSTTGCEMSNDHSNSPMMIMAMEES